MGCGSIIRYRLGRPREESVAAHMSNPRACRKHPDRKEVRGRGRPVAAETPEVP